MTVGEKLCKTCGNNKNYGDGWNVDCKKNYKGLYWKYIDKLHKAYCHDQVGHQLVIDEFLTDMEAIEGGDQDGSSKKDGKESVYGLHG